VLSLPTSEDATDEESRINAQYNNSANEAINFLIEKIISRHAIMLTLI
jgi:hypothetical protein